MFIINREVCQGCGLCLEDCSAGAIVMLDGLAAIAQEKCTGCGLCITSCPQEAIVEVLEPEPEAQFLPPSAPLGQVVTRSSSTLAVREPASPPAPLSSRVLAVAGVALAFLGREIAPFLANTLIDAAERRLSRGVAAAPSRHSPTGPGGQKGRHRRRERGGDR
jgi:NAD-dependent dihydropyrimidine dehydrogenase PreA subunit